MAVADCLKVACEKVSIKADEATQQALKAKQEADRATAVANSMTVTNGALQPMVFLTATDDGQTVFNLANKGVALVTRGGIVGNYFLSRNDTTITIKSGIAKAGDEFGFLIIN